MQIAQFENVLQGLERGDPGRPLALPRDGEVYAQLVNLRQAWQADIRPRITRILDSGQQAEHEAMLVEYRPAVEHFVNNINDLVVMVEHSNARATTLLRLIQVGLAVLAVIGTVLLISLFSRMVIRPVIRLQEGIQRMGRADFDVRLPVTSRDELGVLAEGFNRMAGQLQDIYATLEQRVEEKTRSVETKNRELAARDKEMAVAEERNLLAQELHDSIAQSLAFLNIQVQLLQQDLQQGKTADALQGLAQIREGVQESYDDVRELLVHFRTRIGDTDLVTAIRSALEKFEGQTGTKTSFSLRGTAPLLQPVTVLQVMHILQESLSNVRKHAKASRVDVELVNDGKCRLSVQDNGAGFDAAHDAGDTHVGLRIMRERAHRINANFMLESTPGHGTWVRLTLPTLELEHIT
ncbi:nitrate/nitrite sensor protein NarX [mine drainage metagenome]|uniref:histidine kinase n=1 Tax=mine drainage metagenome TaxID=410659 RepID=A0A1J5QAQ1_9ZZZZ